MAKKEYKKPLVYVQKGNGKKTYQSPKATVYKAEKAPKANNGGGGRRLYRSTPKFSTSVMSAVSLLLVIGLIATVFFAYENSTRAEGEAFQYFSPAKYLDNLSEQEILIEQDTYDVWLQSVWSPIPFRSSYRGYITVHGRKIKSENKIFKHSINSPDLVFSFVINGVLYNTKSYELQGPELEVKYLRKVELPEIVYTLNEAPDFQTVADAWESIGDEGNFFIALAKTGAYIGDMLQYSGNLAGNLLPWNSVVMSNDIKIDETEIGIPWRNANHEYIDLP